jgi:hypothetical protein
METTETPAEGKTFKGSCHCKFITYTVKLSAEQLEKRTVGRCNCTVCLKAGLTGIRVPRENFTLLTPSSFAECKDYRINPAHNIHKYFCGTCGVHVVGEGEFEWKGQTHQFFQFYVTTLEQPQEGLDLSTWKISYVDGRNDRFDLMRSHEEGPFPGGLI